MQVHIFNVRVGGVHSNHSDLQAERVNPLSPELNPICYLLALLAYDILHVSRIRVNMPVAEHLFFW
jgi:transposase